MKGTVTIDLDDFLKMKDELETQKTNFAELAFQSKKIVECTDILRKYILELTICNYRLERYSVEELTDISSYKYAFAEEYEKLHSLGFSNEDLKKFIIKKKEKIDGNE